MVWDLLKFLIDYWNSNSGESFKIRTPFPVTMILSLNKMHNPDFVLYSLKRKKKKKKGRSLSLAICSSRSLSRIRGKRRLQQLVTGHLLLSSHYSPSSTALHRQLPSSRGSDFVVRAPIPLSATSDFDLQL